MAGDNWKLTQDIEVPHMVESSFEDDYGIASSRYAGDADSYDDPYTYSDDSVSLSDAYFFPQPDDDLARPARFREEDALYQHPVGSYGALDNAPKTTPPLWLGGSIIQEDSEMTSLPQQYDDMNSRTTPENGGKRKKNRRQPRRLHAKQRERIAREKAVAQIRGRPQNGIEWRDKVFAFLFLLQLVIICLIALRFGVQMYQSDPTWLPSVFRTKATGAFSAGGRQLHSGGNHAFEFTMDFKNFIDLVSASGIYAFIIVFVSFGFMMVLGKALIQFILVLSILMALGWHIFGLTTDPYGIISIVGFSALLATLGYAFSSWHRIPFIATNLQTAMHAMRSTADITILGIGGLTVALTWIIIWSMAFIGLVNTFNSADCTSDFKCEAHVKNGRLLLYFALAFSFYWTNSVIKNVVRVTVASTVGTWWFRPDHVDPFCTTAVSTPLQRSVTMLLGSVCLGSLVVQPVWLLTGLWTVFGCFFDKDDQEDTSRTLNDERRQDLESNQDLESAQSESAADSIGASLELTGYRTRCHSFLRSCNRWSYSYIGLYGYSFEEAGERALQLFETRGWLALVNDSFINNVLFLACIIIAGSTGTFSVVIEEVDGFFLTSFHKPVITSFLVGSVVGYVLGDILLFGLVAGAVDTILVCFAAAPLDFDKNHRSLSREMREAWSQNVWDVVHNSAC
ncbi:hypothetical protein FisN_10Hh234 [Fistulifera solaris]|uniref:Choline transporter-like protein n=1 Tax=Fistulifera solaris TaxID=1519565 RepID=A0A1Z5JX17_FISSO|nr:hypothetical protein FisN_10Hh234 [Fistulifera solaris]|eukprot:GAX18565.1 hypothetical protein FisN_10Hh234 [Fistulifera solaris]